MINYISHFTWSALFSVIILTSSYSQNSDAPKNLSNTFFLKNCFVVKQPGIILPGQNVIIKDGIIAEIGSALKIPFDAQILKIDSMFVYAGFIDAYSNTGIVKPEPKERAKVLNPGSPSYEIAGITPQILANDFYKSSDKSVSDMRSAGFGLTQSTPRGLMLPGQSSLFFLGDDNNDKLILRSATAQNLQLEPARGVYPSTSIAVLAKFRDLYKNAAIAGNHEEKFKLNPTGLSRPDYSKELLALYPVTIKKMPLYFVAQNTKDVHKALSLKDELGFDLVLTEVKQGWHYIDRIKKNNISVLLSLELPEEEKKDEKKENLKEKNKDEKKDTLAKTDIKEVKKPETDPEILAFNMKKNESTKQYLIQASLYEKNGIGFGFSYLNVKSGDIKKNIRKLIQNGLSENAALAALTINPAKLLGISHLAGTVEKGKIANLVITDKSYFEEKSLIKYVFVDGKKYDFTEIKKQSDSKPDKQISIDGSWSYSVEMPGAVKTGKIKIKKNGNDYTISVVDDATPSKEDTASDIVLEGQKLTFNIIVNIDTPTKVEFDLIFETKKYTGTVNIFNSGSFPISGEYEGDPKK